MELLFAYISAWDDDDMPDGAWLAKLEEGVLSYNKETGTDYDFYDILGDYISWANKQVEDEEE